MIKNDKLQTTESRSETPISLSVSQHQTTKQKNKKIQGKQNNNGAIQLMLKQEASID
jgi:hypothetical protein